jgi:hypothetical protein
MCPTFRRIFVVVITAKVLPQRAAGGRRKTEDETAQEKLEVQALVESQQNAPQFYRRMHPYMGGDYQWWQ